MSEHTSRLALFLAQVEAACQSERGRKAALARFLDVRPSQINEWLTNQRFRPSAEYVLGMAEWLGKLP